MRLETFVPALLLATQGQIKGTVVEWQERIVAQVPAAATQFGDYLEKEQNKKQSLKTLVLTSPTSLLKEIIPPLARFRR